MAQVINADDGSVSGSAGLKSSSDGTAVLTLQTKGSDALTVDASQNVGIGTTSPGAKLSVDGSAIFNDSGADVDFRVESDTDANAFFLDGATGNIGLGTNSPGNYANYRNLAISGTTGGNIDLLNGSTVVGNLFNTSTDFVVLNAANGPLRFGTNNIEKARIDAAGNFGLGVTPSAWFSNAKALEYQGGSLWSSATSNMLLMQNAYLDASAAYIYKNNGAASYYLQSSGAHSWYTVASGTAGGTISAWTQAMTLDASGRLGTGGVTSPTYALDVGNSAGGNMLRMTASTTEMGGFISGGTPFFGAISNHAFALMTNGTERARIHAGGGMTIGSTAAKTTLYVAGNLQVSNTSVSTTTFSSVSSGNAEVALSWVAVSTGFSLPFMINVEVYAVNTSDPSGGSRIYQKDLILYTVNNGNTQTSSVVNITSNSTGSPVTVTTSVQSPGTNGLTVRVAFSGGCNAIIVVTPSAQQLTVV